MFCLFPQFVFIDLSPSFPITTISPGSTSLINSAPVVSSAHDSDATTYAPSWVFPMHNGLNPSGSLNAMSLVAVIRMHEYAPLM